jgi:hypothetical protein
VDELYTGDGFDITQSTVPLKLLVEWILTERAAIGLHEFLCKLCRGEIISTAHDDTQHLLKQQAVQPMHLEDDNSRCYAQMLERRSANSFRYRLRVTPSQPAALAYIFRCFELNKQVLQVQEYAVGQTTLEQIFNQFASSQENPENK